VWDPLQRYLRRRCSPDVADDVLGDVLLVLWRRLDDAPPGAELPWSYAVARGCLANARRGEERRLSLVSRLRRERPPEPALPDDRIGAALARLRPADAELLRLWAWEGLEARDLATVLGCSAGAAATGCPGPGRPEGAAATGRRGCRTQRAARGRGDTR
jgi:RNA polymerase sigma-70 factor (ECF subfamily)